MANQNTSPAAKPAFADNLQDAVGDLAEGAKARLDDTLNDAVDAIQDAMGYVKDAARQRPITAIAIGMGLGLLVALVLGGRQTVYLRSRET